MFQPSLILDLKPHSHLSTARTLRARKHRTRLPALDRGSAASWLSNEWISGLALGVPAHSSACPPPPQAPAWFVLWCTVFGCGGPPGILYPAGLALMCGYIIIPSYMYISASHSGDSKLMRFSAAFWCLRRGPMIRVEGWGFTQRRERLHDTRA